MEDCTGDCIGRLRDQIWLRLPGWISSADCTGDCIGECFIWIWTCHQRDSNAQPFDLESERRRLIRRQRGGLEVRVGVRVRVRVGLRVRVSVSVRFRVVG